MNVVFVGQSPPRAAGPEFRPLSGRSGAMLARVAGIEHDALLARIDALNIFDAYQGRAGQRGDAFNRDSATARAAALPVDGRRVVYLGRAVARAFGHRRVEYLEPLTDARAAAAWCLPHPSGINRWWNDRGNREAARLFLRVLLGIQTTEHIEERGGAA